MKKFYKELEKDKIKINWNKNPIPMKTFLSFLTTKVERQKDFLGSDTGWTQFKGEDELIIRGGVVRGVEYLDTIQYKKNLDNPYNNYVNPFYLFDIFNDEGKIFFLKYYAEDIKVLLEKYRRKHLAAIETANLAKQVMNSIIEIQGELF